MINEPFKVALGHGCFKAGVPYKGVQYNHDRGVKFTNVRQQRLRTFDVCTHRNAAWFTFDLLNHYDASCIDMAAERCPAGRLRAPPLPALRMSS